MTRKQSEMVQNMQSKKKAHKLEEQNMVCLRFHVNKYIKYRLDSFYINISMQFM